MSRVLQIRRGTTAANDKFTGLPGELSFDTDTNTLRVHDGVRLGGYALARADGASTGGSGAFDINSVPDAFWREKIAQFAPAASETLTVLTGRLFPVRATPYIEYQFSTDRTPIFVQSALVCQTPDCGYSIGDAVWAFGIGDYASPRPNVFSDADGLHLRVMIGNQNFWVAHKSTGAKTNITVANWKMQFIVYC